MKYVVFVYTSLCISFMASNYCIADAIKKTQLHLTLPRVASLEPEETSRYYEQALRLALEKTRKPNEKILINHHTTYANRERARLLVKKGIIDVMWSSSTKEREQELTPVKFNLINGVNEYRLLLIRSGDQAIFDSVNSVEDLKGLRVGSGTHWSDAFIYRFNGLPLVTSDAYDSMFRMLSLKRFDYMARSLQEINYELEHYGKLGLVVEKNLVIYYSQPIYFFVNNANAALAKRVELGLEMARDDGSLDALFFSIPSFSQAWEQLQQLDRKMIKLQTPL